MNAEAYHKAQNAIADLKTSIMIILEDAGEPGLRNVEIGRSLGIYAGHLGHEGHIPRTMLAVMEEEGVVEQHKTTKMWSLRSYRDAG